MDVKEKYEELLHAVRLSLPVMERVAENPTPFACNLLRVWAQTLRDHLPETVEEYKQDSQIIKKRVNNV